MKNIYRNNTSRILGGLPTYISYYVGTTLNFIA
jgi:hypothetical protein